MATSVPLILYDLVQCNLGIFLSRGRVYFSIPLDLTVPLAALTHKIMAEMMSSVALTGLGASSSCHLGS